MNCFWLLFLMGKNWLELSIWYHHHHHSHPQMTLFGLLPWDLGNVTDVPYHLKRIFNPSMHTTYCSNLRSSFVWCLQSWRTFQLNILLIERFFSRITKKKKKAKMMLFFPQNCPHPIIEAEVHKKSEISPLLFHVKCLNKKEKCMKDYKIEKRSLSLSLVQGFPLISPIPLRCCNAISFGLVCMDFEVFSHGLVCMDFEFFKIHCKMGHMRGLLKRWGVKAVRWRWSDNFPYKFFASLVAGYY